MTQDALSELTVPGTLRVGINLGNIRAQDRGEPAFNALPCHGSPPVSYRLWVAV